MSYNPFSGWRITGTWADHVGNPPGTGYSLGGTDYPLDFGTPLPAPAAGTLRITGGSGEFAAGLVGSAGRRSVLMLDTPIRDVVAVVFQHQSAFGAPKHYSERDILGWSGASTVVNGNIREYGGDIHLHIHCLTANGTRRRFEDYFTNTSSAAGNTTTILEEDFMSALSDDEQRELFDNIKTIAAFLYTGEGESVVRGTPGVDFGPRSVIGRVNEIGNAIFNGGTSMQDDGKSISQSIAELRDNG